MKVNAKQSAVLYAAASLFALSVLFPPWMYEDGWTSEKRPVGYQFLLLAPEEKPINELRDVFTLPDNGPPRPVRVEVDTPRFYGQTLSLLFLTIGLFLLLSNLRLGLKIALGGVSLIIGFAFLGLLIWYISLPRWY
jgi:hypothetical protein